MITRIEIDGYKNLNGFAMDIKPGLNVLAGPNGVGKSNILEALEFITLLANHNITIAYKAVSDYGSIFHKSNNIYGDEIKFRLVGKSGDSVGTDWFNAEYDIGFSIKRGRSNELLYSSFDIKLKGITGDIERFHEGKVDVSFQGSIDQEPVVFLWKDTGYYQSAFPPKDEDIEDEKEYFLASIKESQYKFSGKALTDVVPRGNYASGSLLGFIIKSEFNFYPYRIIPEKAKENGYSTQTVYIDSNGSSLSSQLYHLLENGSLPIITHHTSGNWKNVSFEEFKSLALLLPINIINFKQIKLGGGSQITILLEVSDGKTHNEFSLKDLSDGTVVWMALMCSLLNHESGWCYDEPEKYLHPEMISKLVSLFRDYAEDKPDTFLLCTTHNETFLNATDVDELQIVTLNEVGNARVGPVKDAKIIKDWIYDTGKGVGQLYFSGAIQADIRE